MTITVEYFLSNGIHFCRYQDAFVFLDLKNDEYSMICGEQAIAFQAVCQRAADTRRSDTDSSSAERAAPPSTRTLELLNELLLGGILTTNPAAGRSVSPTKLADPVNRLVDVDEWRDASVGAGHVLSFVTACVVAAIRLKFFSIQSTVQLVQRRKARRGAGTRLDLCKARTLVAMFARLRAFFPASYLCLFDSLALVEFLARYNLFPSWVFAVQLEPWAAHCWVQHNELTFNEDPEEALDYMPIMVV